MIAFSRRGGRVAFPLALAGPGLAATPSQTPLPRGLPAARRRSRAAASQFARAGAAQSPYRRRALRRLVDDLRVRAAATTSAARHGFFPKRDLRRLREAGADAVLILLRDVDDDRARVLLARAEELGLDTLVEAHDAEELERALALDAPVIGVNARDLTTFEIDRAVQLRLVAEARARAPERVVIAESGVQTRAQGARPSRGRRRDPRGRLMPRPTRPRSRRAAFPRPLSRSAGSPRGGSAVAVAAGADLLGSSSPVGARAARHRSAGPGHRCRRGLVTHEETRGPRATYERENGHRGGTRSFRNGASVARVSTFPCKRANRCTTRAAAAKDA